MSYFFSLRQVDPFLGSLLAWTFSYSVWSCLGTRPTHSWPVFTYHVTYSPALLPVVTPWFLESPSWNSTCNLCYAPLVALRAYDLCTIKSSWISACFLHWVCFWVHSHILVSWHKQCLKHLTYTTLMVTDVSTGHKNVESLEDPENAQGQRLSSPGVGRDGKLSWGWRSSKGEENKDSRYLLRQTDLSFQHRQNELLTVRKDK